MVKLNSLVPVGNSIGLTKLGEQAFTITAVTESSYDGNPSIIITTQEKFEIEGVEYSNFHTQRIAVMDKLNSDAVKNALSEGQTIGPVRCVKSKTKAGKDFFLLEDVEESNTKQGKL